VLKIGTCKIAIDPSLPHNLTRTPRLPFFSDVDVQNGPGSEGCPPVCLHPEREKFRGKADPRGQH